MSFEPVEAVGPLRVRTAEPVVHRSQAVELESRGAALALTSPADQAGSLQHLEVLGDSGLRQRGRLGEFDDTSIAGGQALQDRPAGGVGKGREGSAQLIVSHHTDRLHNRKVMVNRRADHAAHASSAAGGQTSSRPSSGTTRWSGRSTAMWDMQRAPGP